MSCVVVFGRVPVPGRVKTRLAAGIGSRAAAEVYRVTLAHSLRAALDCGARTILSLAEAPPSRWEAPLPVAWEVQSPNDLGARMAEAFDRRFREGHRRVVLVGSDCPELEPRHLGEALERLREVQVVLGPSRDGGYWLVGQRSPGRDLFSGVPWSTAATLAATVDRLRALDVSWVGVDQLVDIDTADDLEEVLSRRRLDPDLERALARSFSLALGEGER